MTETRAQKAQRPIGETTWEQRKRNSWAACLERMAPGLLSGRKATMTETRLQKAQRLVDEGAVHILRTNPHFTQAVVLGEHGHYDTNIYACGHFFCNCLWGQHHSYTDDLCAHALAVKLAMERKKEE